MMTMLLAAGDTPNPVMIQLMPLATTLVVFTIAFWFFKSKVWPKIAAGLDERDRKIREEIKAAEDAREQARAAQSEYEASLQEAKQEAAEMIALAKAHAKQEGDKLRARNESDLVEMKNRAQRDIAAAKQAAIAEIHAEASTLAAAIAGKILKREITVEDQRRLVEESLQELAN